MVLSGEAGTQRVNGDVYSLFPRECCPWKRQTCFGLHKESSNAPGTAVITLPVGVQCMCVCQHVRRKRGAVGVRAVSCWWEWDKNLFPLLKPSALSRASVVFYEATHTITKAQTHTPRDSHKGFLWK